MEKLEINRRILQILMGKFLSASEIIAKLEMGKYKVETNLFYPALSNLQLNQLLCTHWDKDSEGGMIKYYHVTKNGMQFLTNELQYLI